MKTLLRLLALLLFAIGSLSGLALFGAATIADLESVLYGFDRFGYKMTTSFLCPIFLGEDEIGIVRLKLTNPTHQTIRPNLVFQTSAFPLFREERQTLTLAAGETKTVTWTVSQADREYRRYIFAKIYTFASYPAPDLEQTCGIVLLDLPGLTGQQVTAGMVVMSLGGMGLGLLLWRFSGPLAGREREVQTALLALASVVVLGMVSAFFAWWPLGILLLALFLVLVGVILGHFWQSVTH